MPGFALLHGDPNPDLLPWVLHQLEDFIPLGHLAAVVLLVVLIMSVPVATLVLYALQERARKEQQNHG